MVVWYCWKGKTQNLLEFLLEKSHPSIIPIIRNHVSQGATINSDGANVYKCLGNMGYNHNFVLHNRYYFNPFNGTHSNHIENVWSNLKTFLRNSRGPQGNMLDARVDEMSMFADTIGSLRGICLIFLYKILHSTIQ